MTLGQGHDTPLSHGQQLCEILSRSNMTVRELWPGHGFLVCVHCDLDLGDITMTLGQGHYTPSGHWQKLCKLLSRSNREVRSYGPDTDFGYMCTMTLPLGQDHYTPLGLGQQLCEVLSRFNMAVKSYGPDTDFWCVCTLTLTLTCRYDIWLRSWHTLGSWTTIVWNIIQIGQGVRSYGPDTMWTDWRTDRQTGWLLFTPQTLFTRGIKTTLERMH